MRELREVIRIREQGEYKHERGEGLYRGKNIFRKWRGIYKLESAGKDKTVKPG